MTTSFNARLGLSVGTTPIDIINANGSITANTVNATSFTTTNFTANTTGVYPLSNSAGQALGAATQRWILTANSGSFSGDVTVSGNLTVSGTTTYINTTNLDVGDNIITLNADLGAVTPTENAGLIVNRGSSANVSFVWDETNDRWSSNSANIAVGVATTGNIETTGYINVSSTANVGGNVSIGGNLTISGNIITPTIVGTREVRIAMPASDINLASGNYFTRTISGATTLTVSNIPTSGTATSLILDLTNGGSAAITWWSGVKWAGGTAPTLTAAGRDVLGFFTHDNGTTWTGLLLGKDVK